MEVLEVSEMLRAVAEDLREDAELARSAREQCVEGVPALDALGSYLRSRYTDLERLGQVADDLADEADSLIEAPSEPHIRAWKKLAAQIEKLQQQLQKCVDDEFSFKADGEQYSGADVQDAAHVLGITELAYFDESDARPWMEFPGESVPDADDYESELYEEE